LQYFTNYWIFDRIKRCLDLKFQPRLEFFTQFGAEPCPASSSDEAGSRLIGRKPVWTWEAEIASQLDSLHPKLD
jgi:hypothetical protein